MTWQTLRKTSSADVFKLGYTLCAGRRRAARLAARLAGGGIRSFLVLALNRGIGDAVLYSYALHDLRRAFPDARIELVTWDRFAPLLGANRDIDRVIGFGDYDGTRPEAWHRAFRRELRAAKYDVLIDLLGNTMAGPDRFVLERDRQLVAAARADARLGFDDSGQGIRCDRRYKPDFSTHAVLAYAQFLAPLGVAPRLDATGFVPEPLAPAALGARGRRRRIVAFAPGARGERGRTDKRWPAACYARLIDEVLAAHPDVHPVVLGSAGEREYNAAVLAQCTRKGAADLTGKHSLPEFLAAVAACELLVGNDSAPVHVATALGVPTVSTVCAALAIWRPWKFPRAPHEVVVADEPSRVPYAAIAKRVAKLLARQRKAAR